MIVVVISYMFFLTLFLCTLIIHSPLGALVRSSPEVVRSQVFTRLRVLKERKCKKKKQRWSRGHKARGQGQGHKKNPRPRPRTALPRTDPLEAKDKNARGQGPRTQAQVFSKKKGLQKFFSGVLQKRKKRSLKNFSGVLL